MELISREDLKQKLDEGEDLKLVCALSEWAFRAMHIPGSFHIDGPGLVAELLDKDDQIVVYCTNPNSVASVMAYDAFAGLCGAFMGLRYRCGSGSAVMRIWSRPSASSSLSPVG